MLEVELVKGNFEVDNKGFRNNKLDSKINKAE